MSPTIGLEIHIELKTGRKMFCSCPNNPEEKKPNVNICPICLAHPGTLPTINKKAVEKVIKTGMACHCQISDFSFFERKSYFYPDLPKGFQTSQYQNPLCQNGYLDIQGKKISIQRIHLEEDTAKISHTKNGSLLDFNRAGVPLMELVTEPVIENGEEAKEFAKELQRICRYLDISNADMEKGEMRVEVNISLKNRELKAENQKLGTKVEIKNLNSFRAVERSIDYEIKRQTKVLENGEKVIQETRGWDDFSQKTVSQRIKEESHDYRYFPEPDLLPFKPKEVFDLEEFKNSLGELPYQKREKYLNDFKIPLEQVNSIIDDKKRALFFEKIIDEINNKFININNTNKPIQLAANYFTSDLFGLAQKYNFEISESKIKPKNFASLIVFLLEEKIQTSQAKIILEEMVKTGKSPAEIIEEKGIKKIEGNDLERVIGEVIEENQKAIDDFKKGKSNALQFLIGQTMRKTRGQADINLLREIIKEKIELKIQNSDGK